MCSINQTMLFAVCIKTDSNISNMFYQQTHSEMLRIAKELSEEIENKAPTHS
jgi:hypothetical protein